MVWASKIFQEPVSSSEIIYDHSREDLGRAGALAQYHNTLGTAGLWATFVSSWGFIFSWDLPEAVRGKRTSEVGPGPRKVVPSFRIRYASMRNAVAMPVFLVMSVCWAGFCGIHYAKANHFTSYAVS